MPVTTDTLWNMKRLNRVFGVSALLGLVSFGWMMWHDYQRPWRDIQTGFFNTRSAMAHITALTYESPEEQERLKSLEKAVDDAEADLDRPEVRERIDALETKRDLLAGELQGVALTYGNRNAELGVTVFLYEEKRTLLGDDHDETVAFKERLDNETEHIEGLKSRKEKIEDDLRSVSTQLKEINFKKAAADRALQAYNKGLNDAQARDRKFGPGVQRFFLNLPILDAFPTKDTPGRQEVRQVFMPDIRVDYNFTDSYATDRCITCHVGIDDPAFTKENYVKQAEKALRTATITDVLREKNEALTQELARRLADVEASEAMDKTAFINAFVNAANIYLEEIRRPMIRSGEIQAAFPDAKPDRGQVMSQIETRVRKILSAAPPMVKRGGNDKPLAYAEMSPEQRADYFKALTAAVNTYLDAKDRPEARFDAVLAAHPRLDLFLSPESPHPMKKMGCTVCHEGSGQDTDFILAAHTPKNQKEKDEWKKYYVKELGIPLATFHLVEEFWERPMLLTKYTSASCVKCHEQAFDLERAQTAPLVQAQNLVEGRELFTKVGCINCHSVEGLADARRVGTDLTHVGEKLSMGFIERWIDYPNNFRASTRMPHFFHQENSTETSRWDEYDPHPVMRSHTEVKAIAHYLKVFTKPWDPNPLPEGVTGDPARGGELVKSIGCFACHMDMEATDPLDSDGRSFAQKWIVTDIAMAHAEERVKDRRVSGSEPTAAETQAMIDAALPDAQAAFEKMSKNDRTRYASRRFSDRRREQARLTSKTEAFVAETEERDPDPLKIYVPPEFIRHAPELSGMGTKLVNDPNDAEQVKHGQTWLYNWLENPRHYSSYTVMPRLFTENYYSELPPGDRAKQAQQDIMDVVAYLLSLRNDDFATEPLPETPEHDSEMQRLILMLLGGQNTESVSKRILNDEKSDPAEEHGPLTRAIIAQVTPSFGGGDEARAQIVQLLASKSGSLKDRQKLYFGMKMIGHYGCYACHTIAGFEDATRPGTDLTTWAQKFMSQLDFAFFSHVFEHEREEQPEKWAGLYLGSAPDQQQEFKHLIRDVGESADDLVSGSAGAIPASGNPHQDILQNHASFAYHKMRNPRIYDRGKLKKPYEKLKMPNYYFTEEESTALTTYLLSKREGDVRESVQVNYDNTPVGRIARGRALVHELNCIGCHTIEGDREATIQQYYSDDPAHPDDFKFGARFKPPLLWGEGAKVQYDWLFSFLNNVEMLRPWLDARMPSFFLSTEDATTLVEYFAGLSEYEAKLLKDQIAPVALYLQQVHSGASSTPENPHWYAEDSYTDEAEFLQHYALRHKQATPYEFDISAANTPQEVIETLANPFQKALARATFLANVFDIEFPYSDPETHTVDDARFKLGEEFFYDLKCLACHVGGDPSLPGTTTDIKAPNFALTHKRLQYEWVVKWLQDPQAIQPGANMPQIFQGGSAYASLPEDQRTAKEAQFGKTVDEQASLLIDFLYEMGERRHTAIQPGAAEAATQKATEEEVEFDFGGGDAAEEEKKEEEVEFDFDG
ncbi:MAG TPA: hypothetical protein VNT79_11025 [Phycisphaerae bacterium]|nr:hypothetical protein [Phycisphaerae bacterium]